MTAKKKIKVCVAVLLCVITTYIYMPGSYSNDSWAQYIHMTIHWCDDWFGPGMVKLWGLLYSVTGHYESLFLVMMISYWLFIALLTWDVALGSPAYWVLVTAAVFCCFIPQYIMRDGLMCISLAFACLILLRPLSTRLVPSIAMLLLLVTYALLLRPNILIAITPLLLAMLFVYWPRLGFSSATLSALALTALLFFATEALSYRFFHATRAYPAYKLKLLDMAGISRLSGHNYFPSCITDSPSFNYATIIQHYTPASFDDIYWADKPLIPAPTAALNSCVQKSWVDAITEHPGLYLQNRCTGFLYYLHISKRLPRNEYQDVYIDIDTVNPLGVKSKPNALRNSLKRMYSALGNTPFFDPWLWLLLNLAALAYTIYQYKQSSRIHLKALACIQLSGVLLVLSQFPVYQHDKDFRYSYWCVFVVMISFGVLKGTKRNA